MSGCEVMDTFLLYILVAVVAGGIAGILGFNFGWLRAYDQRTEDVEHYRKLWGNEVEHSGKLWNALCECDSKDDSSTEHVSS